MNQQSPVRSKARTQILFFLAASAGVTMFALYHVFEALGFIAPPPPFGDSIGTVAFGVDIALGVLALALLPSAIRHDPMEVEYGYVGPPSALVASLVILSVWMVSLLAAPAGAIVLISLSARLSLNWTAPAVCASLMSALVYQLTHSPAQPDISWTTVLGSFVLTLMLIAMGSVRGLILRRQAQRAKQMRQSQSDQPTEQTQPG
ncbi:hypothetical protein [Brevibacterium sp. HMSC07C04]|uniref:hypothetical protein n=1 Tax=Brevibacterium sp. HMSC07C04 TaxID=1581130 RepID=UPI000AA43997|nr:hypothetical protein [Brevibacterium sp. HMSC07C04]